MSLDQLDRRKFLALLTEWSSHRVYYPQHVAGKLSECGLDAKVSEDEKAVLLEGVRVQAVEPEWGSPGISPLSVLEIVYELTVGSRPVSHMIGRGFWYRDVAGKLKKHWFPDGP